MSLEGQVAVVTGGASGKGEAVKRPGTPQDIADCVRFLVRPESSWITGQTFNVDGGHRFN